MPQCHAMLQAVLHLKQRGLEKKLGEVLSYSKIYQITGISRNEAGAYACLAWNGIGKNNSKSCLVVVQCKCTISFLFITWACLEMIVSVYVLIVKKTISSDPFGKQIVIERKYILLKNSCTVYKSCNQFTALLFLKYNKLNILPCVC